MALNNIQERVERSIYEAIRKALVLEGYLPDITNFSENTQGQSDWDEALKQVANAREFAAELYSVGSAFSKELKKTPRIAMVNRRIMPGEIGAPITPSIIQDPNNPNQFIKVVNPLESANLHIDIHLASSSSAQDRVLNAIMARVIGQKNYLKFYDNPKEVFFIRQFNYYDLPDAQEGIQEKVYSYEVMDIFLYQEVIQTNIPLINEITINTPITNYENKITQEGSIIGPYVTDEGIFIDLSGIRF